MTDAGTTDASGSGAVFNHVGQCVTDLARAKRFYVEALGFTVEREITPTEEESARLLGLRPPLAMTACYLVRGSFVLELLHFGAPGVVAPYRPRSVAEPGLTHLSVSVDDLDTACARVEEHGGTVLHETRIEQGVFVRDPEGQLVELLPTAYRDYLAAKGYT
jgi:catechol 2,3-dioxygenase-like lactoylglutathione lyase family enzyme